MSLAAWASLAAVVVTGLNAWLIYLGSDRASKRSTAVQQQANGVDGLATLSQEQRAELTRVYARADAAEARAGNAEDRAGRAEREATEAHRTADELREIVTELTTAYRELYAWACQPCPHEQPPPDPPPRLAMP